MKIKIAIGKKVPTILFLIDKLIISELISESIKKNNPANKIKIL